MLWLVWYMVQLLWCISYCTYVPSSAVSGQRKRARRARRGGRAWRARRGERVGEMRCCAIQGALTAGLVYLRCPSGFHPSGFHPSVRFPSIRLVVSVPNSIGLELFDFKVHRKKKHKATRGNNTVAQSMIIYIRYVIRNKQATNSNDLK